MRLGNAHLAPLQEERLGSVLRAWQREFPGLGVLALLPEAEKTRLPLLQSLCRELDIPLVGGIFPALLTASGFVTEGVWLLRFDRMVPAVLVPALDDATADPVGKIVDAVRPLLDEAAPELAKPTLYLLFDGLLPQIASLLDGLYLALADRVDYAGANAGSETFTPMPCLFDREQAIAGGACCLLLPEAGGTILEHAYPAGEQVMSATSTAGNRIDQIDWRPAFDTYREIVGRSYGIELTPDNFYEYAVHFPLGILRANGEVVVRIPVGLSDDGAVHCVGEVPENAMLVVLKAPSGTVSGCVDKLAAELEAGNGSLAETTLLTFYCAGRRMHLGQAAGAELADLDARLAPAVLAGALSLGEIGGSRQWAYPSFHNAALVCTPWERA